MSRTDRQCLGLVAIVIFGGGLLSTSVHALSHADRLKFPLTEYYPECGPPISVANCPTSGNGFTALDGTYEFGKGTFELRDNGSVGLRIDALRPRGDCPVGQSCQCQNSPGGGVCFSDADCTPPNQCVAAPGNVVQVEIWAQQFALANQNFPAPCDTSACIIRSAVGQCNQVFNFTVGSNGNIDASLPASSFTCLAGSGSTQWPEIRAIEVRDPTGSLLGVMSFGGN